MPVLSASHLDSLIEELLAPDQRMGQSSNALDMRSEEMRRYQGVLFHLWIVFRDEKSDWQDEMLHACFGAQTLRALRESVCNRARTTKDADDAQKIEEIICKFEVDPSLAAMLKLAVPVEKQQLSKIDAP